MNMLFPTMRSDESSDGSTDQEQWHKAVSEVEAKISQLEAAVDSLPMLDANSHSEMDETAYALKEKLEKEVADGMGRLRGMVGAIDMELRKCRGNMDRISSDATHLHLSDAVAAYDDAHVTVEKEVERLLRQRERVFEAIEKGEQALARARRKKWSFGTPKDRSDRPGSTRGGSAPSPQDIFSDGKRDDVVAAEVSDLLEMGRI